MSIDTRWRGSRLSTVARLGAGYLDHIQRGVGTEAERVAWDYLGRAFREGISRPLRGRLHPRAIIGDHNLGDIADFDDALAVNAGHPVAALMTAGGPATGFLVDESLVLTNHHVFPNRSSAVGAVARMNFQRLDGSLMAFEQYSVDPSVHYAAAPEVDAAVVGVRGRPGDRWGKVDLSRIGVAVEGRPAYVIQHPHGLVKQIGVRDNEIREVTDTEVLYSSDTERGSSGAPVFDERFDIIALHAEGGHIADIGPDGTAYFANKGVRIELVKAALNL